MPFPENVSESLAARELGFDVTPIASTALVSQENRWVIEAADGVIGVAFWPTSWACGAGARNRLGSRGVGGPSDSRGT